MAATTPASGEETLDEILWRSLKPAAADQRRLYAAALALNPACLPHPGRLPKGLVVTLPERPDPKAPAPVALLRIFG
jgi:hypothetical protein